MARAHFISYALDNEGRPIAGCTVTVREPDTTTPIAQTIYAGDTGVTTKTNPFTADADGKVEFYLDTPQIVDILVTKTGFESRTQRAVVHQLTTNTLVLKDAGAAMAQRDGTNFLDGFVLTDDAADNETDVELDWGLAGDVEDIAATGAEGSARRVADAAHSHGHPTGGFLPDAHHDKAHIHDGVDGSGTVSHDVLTGVSADDHHAQIHDLFGGDHTNTTIDHGTNVTGLEDDDHPHYLKEKASGGVASEVPTHDHSAAGNAGKVDHVQLNGITADDHHAEQHDASKHDVLWMKHQKSAVQAVADAANLASTTRISWSASGEIVNTLGATLDDANDRFTLPLSGVYEILLEVPWESQATVYDTLLSIRGPGGTPTLINEPQRVSGANDNVEAYVQKLHVIEEFQANDVIQFHASQSSGGARNIGHNTDSLYRVRLTIRYIGPTA